MMRVKCSEDCFHFSYHQCRETGEYESFCGATREDTDIDDECHHEE